ncbi:ATP-binding protein [Myroides odoratus]|uniref:Divergent AAA domain n=1 Tax=Myroides odoratus TaxID=256 RepID=A0A378RI64_MYROD|nr:ATP-binding protein [Myroides odoratus]QQU02359.1 ATP-binding protein [Myroides odoratus]STZ26702.1 Divergent AAA domain [Myroides odoratus]
MNKEIFETLIKQKESKTLDFKLSEYDFSSNAHESKKADFIKDIISFSNTIRNESSYIIIGVEEVNSQNVLRGIPQTTDDSILQQKIKNVVFPIPFFKYYPFIYNNLIFGIIEIPVKKYVMPITPVVKLKGLIPGKTYFRRNSCNDEANSAETIEINNWLNSLSLIENSFEKIVQKSLYNLLQDNLPLSKVLFDLLITSKQYNLIVLKEFCEKELNGFVKNVNYLEKDIDTVLRYRIKTVLISHNEININALSNYTSSQVLQILKNDWGAREQEMFLQFSITKIENYIENFPLKKQSLMYFKQKMENNDVYIYFEKQTLVSYYNSIKEELKSQLIKLL